MAAAITTKTAKDGASTPATFPLGMLDVSGTGAGPFVPLHALYDSSGALINPATKEGVAAIATALAGTIAVSAQALPLPAGASTSAKQDAAATILGNILTALGPLATDADLTQGFGSVVAKDEQIRALLAGTLAISAATLPLPAGAATDAKVEAVRALLAGTLAISASALPLPAGAATSAKQDTTTAAIAATGPGTDGFSVTPNDTTNFTSNARALYVGVAGDVTLVTPAGTVLLHKNVPSGATLAIGAKRVNATGTTATNILGYL